MKISRSRWRFRYFQKVPYFVSKWCRPFRWHITLDTFQRVQLLLRRKCYKVTCSFSLEIIDQYWPWESVKLQLLDKDIKRNVSRPVQGQSIFINILFGFTEKNTKILFRWSFAYNCFKSGLMPIEEVLISFEVKVLIPQRCWTEQRIW